MTTNEARALAAEYQARCDAMGPRHGETDRLGKAISVILDLCAQLEAVDAELATTPNGDHTADVRA